MQITRYPVKSMAGENVRQTPIAAYGLYGDRSHAFVDETKEGWDRYFTARQIPNLLGYKVRFIEELFTDKFPSLQITSPNGQVFDWGDDLLKEIQSFSERKMSMIRHQPNSQDLLAVDTGGILIISDHTFNKLENILGKEIDQRRFRANLIISLSDESIHDETELVGKQICVGGTRLYINEECERCSMITINPDTYERDAYILKIVKEEMNLNFGVYASIVEVGDVRIGDKVSLVE